MEEKLNLRLGGVVKLKVTTRFKEVIQDFEKSGENKMLTKEKPVTSVPSGSRVVFYKYDDEVQKTDSFGEYKTVIQLPTFELQIINEQYDYETTLNGQDYVTDEQRDLAMAAVREKIMYGWEDIEL